MSLDSKDMHRIIVLVVFIIAITIILCIEYVFHFDSPTATLVSGAFIGFWVVMKKLHLLN